MGKQAGTILCFEVKLCYFQEMDLKDSFISLWIEFFWLDMGV
jgi:hypothetical protein